MPSKSGEPGTSGLALQPEAKLSPRKLDTTFPLELPCDTASPTPGPCMTQKSNRILRSAVTTGREAPRNYGISNVTGLPIPFTAAKTRETLKIYLLCLRPWFGPRLPKCRPTGVSPPRLHLEGRHPGSGAREPSPAPPPPAVPIPRPAKQAAVCPATRPCSKPLRCTYRSSWGAVSGADNVSAELFPAPSWGCRRASRRNGAQRSVRAAGR